ncbi:TIR domain-containing protein [Neorhizobium sp. T25_13]|uniref:TIR domain-containing protein n=1 Tax=Neorhizobium sp. T25_13 TaxID=2093830 RepID=UPI000CF85400|nr:TIR domain-containing protein [Neorhizobium sp. T25_13]
MAKVAASKVNQGGGKVSNPQPSSIEDSPNKRTYLKQSDVPIASLDDALRVPQVIFDQYAGKPTSPFNVAMALNVDPKGSQLRVLSGAAIAFGLIEGGAQASSISVTELARRIIRPKVEGEDIDAKREAVLKPRIFGDFLRNYDGNVFPRQDLAVNVLEDMGVPRAKAVDVLERMNDSARSVGFIVEHKGKHYVQLNGLGLAASRITEVQDSVQGMEQATDDPEDAEPVTKQFVPPAATPHKGAALTAAVADDHRRRRVFVTHGKDRALVEPIKKLLEYGELEPVVSVERQSVSKPVPEKVMDDMRKCGAAIIHVDADKIVKGVEGEDHVFLNPNVLIEIGAAMAFYGRRFILLVKDGVKLPSNLQGLYEVRYTGDTLDANSTIKLLEAMKDIKNYSLPYEVEEE